jgi:Ser/Thr protein kinase RdoA (MazF antagonist)
VEHVLAVISRGGRALADLGCHDGTSERDAAIVAARREKRNRPVSTLARTAMLAAMPDRRLPLIGDTALSYDDRVELLARAALPCWGIEGAALRLLNRSENSTYLVEPAGGPPSILRVHRTDYHTRDGIRSELAWMRALQAEAGVKTPQAIPALDGDEVQEVSHPALPRPRQAVLFEFIEGAEPDPEGDLRTAFDQLGEVTARTHEHSRGWARPSYFERLTWDFEHMLGEVPNWGPWDVAPGITPARRPSLERLVERLEHRLRRFGQAPDRYGLIHADFRLANILVHDGELRVIDFDDCGLGWYLYDLGTALTMLEDAPDVESLVAAWLNGYRRVRALPGEDETEIWTFLMLRRMTVLAWLGSHGDTHLAGEQALGYAENTCALADRYLSRFR